jgi:nucleoside-diphosphate-sugar epimerase
MTEKILITGAEGTVGAAAGRYLTEEGFEVVGVGLEECDEKCYTRIRSLDLTESSSKDKLADLLEDVDTVFHLAWNLSRENFDTESSWQGNMKMFENVLEASKEAGIDVFINGSSIHAGTSDISAYTKNSSLEETPQPYRKSIDPETSFDLRKQKPSKLLDPRAENPDSPYGESKIETEHKTREAVQQDEIKTGVSIRIGGVNSEDQKTQEGEPYYSTLYLSHKDLGRTVKHIVEKGKDMNGYYQIYGVSDNKGRVFDIENPFIGEH